MKEFGQRVGAYMERQDLSARALARDIHIRRSTISRVLKGEMDLSPQDAQRFEQGLKVSTPDRIEFNLSSQGVTNERIEQIQGRPLRDLDDIRHAKRKLVVRGSAVIRYSY